MTSLLIRVFIKNPTDTVSTQSRRQYGLLGSLTGIVMNLLLFSAKLAVGLLSSSVAVLADAFNNLSDIGSSVVALVGFKLSTRPADRGHPFGHGRLEYLSGFIVALAILVMGAELLKSSIKKIIHPQPVVFGWGMAVVLLLSVFAKLWMSFFSRKISRIIDSAAMQASAYDSLSDSISTFAVLVAMLLYWHTGIGLDAWMGAVVAVFILISGLKIAKDMLNPLLGPPPDAAFVDQLKNHVLAYDGIVGVHDLMVHDYGPGRRFVSLHAEVPAGVDICVSHDVVDCCEREVGKALNIQLVIHMDPIVVDDEEADNLRIAVQSILTSIDPQLSMHDFCMVRGNVQTTLIFRVAMGRNPVPDENWLKNKIQEEVSRLGMYHCVIEIDRSVTTKSLPFSADGSSVSQEKDVE